MRLVQIEGIVNDITVKNSVLLRDWRVPASHGVLTVSCSQARDSAQKVVKGGEPAYMGAAGLEPAFRGYQHPKPCIRRLD